jgi:hypothetical protein
MQLAYLSGRVLLLVNFTALHCIRRNVIPLYTANAEAADRLRWDTIARAFIRYSFAFRFRANDWLASRPPNGRRTAATRASDTCRSPPARMACAGAAVEQSATVTSLLCDLALLMTVSSTMLSLLLLLLLRLPPPLLPMPPVASHHLMTRWSTATAAVTPMLFPYDDPSVIAVIGGIVMHGYRCRWHVPVKGRR